MPMTKIQYPDHKYMMEYLFFLQKENPNLCLGNIGYSEEKRELPLIVLGQGPKKIFYAAAFHSLESITTLVLLEFISDLLICAKKNVPLLGFDVKEIFSRATFYILPQVNPDGINLVLNGFESDNQCHQKILSDHGEDILEFWQSNIRGVDLNHNYDACFYEGKAMETQYHIFGPGPTRYGGECPESESETKAICAFVRKTCPHLVLALHTQGEEIYYDFCGKVPKKGLEIGKIYSQLTSYKLCTPEEKIAGARGFKDWFIKEFRRPGFTFELGLGKNPLPLSDFESIYGRVLEALLITPYLI